jgi:hypothetical protein
MKWMMVVLALALPAFAQPAKKQVTLGTLRQAKPVHLNDAK